MKILSMVVVCSFVSSFAFAIEKKAESNRKVATTGPAILEEISQKTYANLEASVKRNLVRNWGAGALKNFKMDYEGANQCVEKINDMDNKRVGACLVHFSAWQTMGEALIVVSRKGVTVQILDVTIE